MPKELTKLLSYTVPLRAYNITGLKNVRAFFKEEHNLVRNEKITARPISKLKDVIDDLYGSHKKVIFTMGKGGVGKTTVAAAIALGLSQKGEKVHLATTDPAAHLKFVIDESCGVSLSHIDEAAELKKYQNEVLSLARKTMTEDDIAYIEEDLRSPCTQEIAVFRAFAQIVEKADDQIVVIDTAPTGHTLLLLDSTQSYHNEIKRSQGDIPQAVKNLLPRLRNAAETEVVIVTLAEATPFYEAVRLEEDLKRAGIAVKWWIINASLYQTKTTNELLAAKANIEIEWINKIAEHSNGYTALTAWSADEIKGGRLLTL